MALTELIDSISLELKAAQACAKAAEHRTVTKHKTHFDNTCYWDGRIDGLRFALESLQQVRHG